MIALEIDRISISRIKTYQQCELQYDAVYNRGKRQEGEPLWFGTIVHETLENYHKDPTKDILELFDEAWVKSSLTNLDYYRDGREMLQDYLLTAEYHAHPIALDSDRELCLETYFRIPLDKDRKVIASGIIDRIDHISENHCEVIDYKTSRMPYTRDEVDNDIQLTMYNLAVNHLYPQYTEVDLSLLFLRFKKLTTTRTPEELEEARQFFINTFYQIKYNDDPQPRLNKYCGYCPIKDECPAYKELTQEQRILFGDVPDSAKLMWEELETIKDRIKVLYDRRKELETALKTQLTDADKDGIIIGDQKIYLAPQPRSEYTFEAVANLVGVDEAIKMSNIKKTAVDKAVKHDKQAQEYLKENAIEYYNEPRIKTRFI